MKNIGMILLVLGVFSLACFAGLAAEKNEQTEPPQKFTYKFDPGEKISYTFKYDLSTKISGEKSEGLLAILGGQTIKSSVKMQYDLSGEKPKEKDSSSLKGKISHLLLKSAFNMGGLMNKVRMESDGKKTSFTLNGQDVGSNVQALGFGKKVKLDFVGKNFDLVVSKTGKTTTKGAPEDISTGQMNIAALGGFFPIITFPDKALSPGESWSEKNEVPSQYEGVTNILERKYTLEYYTSINSEKCAKILIDTKSYQKRSKAADKNPESKKFVAELSTTGHAFYRLKDKRIIEINMDIKQKLCVPVKQLGGFMASDSTGKLTNIITKPEETEKK